MQTFLPYIILSGTSFGQIYDQDRVQHEQIMEELEKKKEAEENGERWTLSSIRQKLKENLNDFENAIFTRMKSKFNSTL